MLCRICGSNSDLRLVPKRGFFEQRVLVLLGVRPIECSRCGLRFLSRKQPRMSKPRSDTQGEAPSRAGRTGQASPQPTGQGSSAFLEEIQRAEARIFSEKETKRAS